MNLKTSSDKSLISEGIIAEDCPSHTAEEWLVILQKKSLALGKPIPWYDIKQDPELNHKEILKKLGTYSVFEKKLLIPQGDSNDQEHDVRDAEKASEPSATPKDEKAMAVKKACRKRDVESNKSDAKADNADGNKVETKKVCANKVESKDDPVVESQHVDQQCDPMDNYYIKEMVKATAAKPSTECTAITTHVPKDPVIGVDPSILSQTAIVETLDQKKATKLEQLLEETAAEEMKAIGQLACIRTSAWREAPKYKKTVNVMSFGTKEVYFLEGQLVVVPKPSTSLRCRLAPDDILCMFVSSGIMDGGREYYFSCIRMCKKLETGGWEVRADDLEGYVRLSSTMKGFRDTKSILSILSGGDPWRVVKRVMVTKAKQVICEISNRNGDVIGYVYMQAIKPVVLKDECLTLYFCLFELDFSEPRSGSSSDFPMSTDCLVYRQQYSRDGGLQIIVQQTVSFSM